MRLKPSDLATERMKAAAHIELERLARLDDAKRGEGLQPVVAA